MKKVIFLFLFFTAAIYSQDTLVFKADYIPYPDTVMVFTPSGMQVDTEYPVLYLLHGWTGYWSYWGEIADVQYYSDKYNFIIVCPDGFSDSWYLNNPMKPNVQFEKFFWADLVPGIESKYKIDYKNIFITGLSMGGHGSMLLFLRNNKYFNAAGSMSGIMDLTHFPDRWSIKEGIGSIKDYPEVWKNNSVINLLGNIKGLDKKLILECGVDDFAYEVNENFYNEALKQGIDIKFISRPGKHNREFWRVGLKNHMEFFNKMKK